MKILVLGSEGFIGHHLVEHFSKKGYDVEGCDLTEYFSLAYTYHKVSILSADFEDVFTGQKFDICVNASGSGNVGYSIIYPQSDFELNSNAVSHALDALRKHCKTCRFIHISSAAVYGNPQVLPILESAPPDPLSPYGFHKLISELICKEYFTIYKIPIAIVRPFSVFGNGLKKQLFWDICQKLKTADEIELFGTGNETRDFIHIHDLVKAIECIIEKSLFQFDIYNLASGKSTAIKSVAAFFEKKLTGKKVNFSGEIKRGDPSQWQADISAIKQLGFIAEANFEKSISDYIDWESKLRLS